MGVVQEYEMEVHFAKVGCQTRGYVAGHHRLVPTCGSSNEQVIYYMVHLGVVQEYEMEVHFAKVGCQTRGYVAGHHRLVPTCGSSNEQVIYYMVHLMEDASELESDKRIEMIMNGRAGDKYHVQIATSERTFRRIVSAADEVANDQLSLFEYWMHRLGKVKRELFERTYFGDYCVYTKLRKLALDLFISFPSLNTGCIAWGR